MTRVWFDGCFDLFHYGHANSLRQAKQMGDILVVGIHNDAEIQFNKGQPVMTEEERYRMLYSMKWVDEIVEGSPFCPNVQTVQSHNCDFAAHGDDVSVTLSGGDTYGALKEAGIFKLFERTKGVSTTEIIQKILCSTNGYTQRSPDSIGLPLTEATGVFLASNHWISLFSEGQKKAKTDDKIVYVDGCWDLLNAGHVDFLEEASKLGTHLIVGVHSDELVREKHGLGRPVMNLMERTLVLLACKAVSEVIIGSTYQVTKEMITQLKIDLVCSGPCSTARKFNCDPYLEAKKCGKFKLLDGGSKLRTHDVIERVLMNKETYQTRNKGKESLDSN